MSVVGKGRRCGRVVACRSGLFRAPNSLALVLLTASPAAAQSAAEGNRNPTALPQVTIEAPKLRRPAVRRASPATQPALTAAPRVQQPAPPPSPSTPSGTSTSGVGAAPTINLAAPASTASRLNLSRLQTPASVEIITAETIAERGQHSVIEAVTQNAAGFTASPAPGNGSLSFNTRGFTGNGTVMTLYDGTRLYVGAGTLTFPLDSWSADRIEVLRGPASVMYGEGAIGGAINIIPKGPIPFARNEAEVSFDTNGTRRIAVDSGGPVNKDVTYRFAATGNLSDGWVDRDNTSNGALTAAVRVQSADNVAWTLSTDYADRKPSRYFGTPLINGRLDESLRFTNFNVSDSNIHYRDSWTRLKTEWDVNNDVSIHNVLYYLNSQRHWKDVETYSWNAKTGLVDRTSYIEIFHDQQQIGNRMDATVRGQILGFKNDFVTGFDVNRIDFTHTNNSPFGGLSSVDPFSTFDPGLFNSPNATVPAFNTVTNQYALFAEDRLLVTPQWSIVGGVRYDQPTIDRTDLLIAANSFEKSFSAVSWRAGTVYTPFPNFAIYGQYSTAVDPVGNLITLATTQKDFVLSTGRQAEVGVKQSFWNGRGEWTLAGYDIVKNNLLARDPNNPTVTVQIGQQSSRGVEASLGFVLDGGWRIDANTALLRARFDDFVQSVGGQAVNFAGNVPNNVPQQVSNIWLTWKFAPDWLMTGGVQIVGDTWADNADTVKRPSYSVVNVGLQWKPYDNTTISARVYNLFDTVYATSGGTTQWLLGRPRTGEIALNVKF
jgi:iron complex outermembrane receptor protein